MAQPQLTATVESPPPFRSKAAHKIKAYRRRNNLTAAALGEQLGVSDAAVIYWESGQRVPRHDLQGKLLAEGICAPNDWHVPAPGDDAADSGAAASAGQ